MAETWSKTACILCSQNCGVEVQLEGRRIARVRGDKAHPTSKGYTCEKALRLDHYQNARGRLASPLRRRDDGTFEEIDWETAIREVAGRLARVRDEHGGETIFYYGGGGQGNHLPGVFSRATRAALGSVFASNALLRAATRSAPDRIAAAMRLPASGSPSTTTGTQRAAIRPCRAVKAAWQYGHRGSKKIIATRPSGVPAGMSATPSSLPSVSVT